MTRGRSLSYSCAQARELALGKAQEVEQTIESAVDDAGTLIAVGKVVVAAGKKLKRKMQAAALTQAGVVGYLGDEEEGDADATRQPPVPNPSAPAVQQPSSRRGVRMTKGIQFPGLKNRTSGGANAQQSVRTPTPCACRTLTRTRPACAQPEPAASAPTQ